MLAIAAIIVPAAANAQVSPLSDEPARLFPIPQLAEDEIALLDACDTHELYYCLRDLDVVPGTVTIGFTGAGEDGRIRGCAAADDSATRMHAIACRYYATRFTYPGPRGYLQPQLLTFSFIGPHDPELHPVPDVMPVLVMDGYPPSNPGAVDEEPCTNLVCRWQYPTRALRNEEEGAVTVFIGVGKNGSAYSCSVFMGQTETLNRATCDRFTADYVRYEPARDAAGNPREAVATYMMNYVIN